MEFNEKLLNLRKEKGLSQEELGEKLGVTRQTVSKWELGSTSPKLDDLTKISELFNISIDELVNGIEKSKEEVKTKRKINKKIILVLWIIICALLGLLLYRYLSIRNVVNEYYKHMEQAKQNGGMVKIMKTVDSEFEPDNAYINHYFKGNIENIQYYALKEDGDSGYSYLYKIVYKDKDNVYTIDEVNKTYTIDKRMTYSENGPLDEIESKVNINLLETIYKKNPVLFITFNSDYHTKIDRQAKNSTQIGLQKGNPANGSDNIVVLMIDDSLKSMYYMENYYKTGDRTKIDANSYFYSDIGKTIELYIQKPDLTDYTLIEK